MALWEPCWCCQWKRHLGNFSRLSCNHLFLWELIWFHKSWNSYELALTYWRERVGPYHLIPSPETHLLRVQLFPHRHTGDQFSNTWVWRLCKSHMQTTGTSSKMSRDVYLSCHSLRAWLCQWSVVGPSMLHLSFSGPNDIHHCYALDPSMFSLTRITHVKEIARFMKPHSLWELE